MDIVLRAGTIFLVVFLLTRVMGRRELSGLEPFDLVVIVVIVICALCRNARLLVAELSP